MREMTPAETKADLHENLTLALGARERNHAR
jgi:hypothetical protein